MTDAKYRVAIHRDHVKLARDPRQSFHDRWTTRLLELGHEPVTVDALAPDIVERLEGFHAFLWWFPPVPARTNPGRRLMQALEARPDLVVFPDRKAAWHYDDKAAQALLFAAANIPVPATWLFWQESDALEFCRKATYPLVMKLGPGFYSRNVRLLRSSREAMQMVRRMFDSGVYSLEPERGRLRFVPRPLRRRLARWVRGGPALPLPELQRDYFLAQEFVPANEFDTRVFVIAGRAVAFRRANRPDDFRASGSGLIESDPRAIASDAVHLALHTARILAMDVMSCDILRKDGRPVITEVCFYAEGWMISRCPGHWTEGADGALVWHDQPLRAEDAILDAVLTRLDGRR